MNVGTQGSPRGSWMHMYLFRHWRAGKVHPSQKGLGLDPNSLHDLNGTDSAFAATSRCLQRPSFTFLPFLSLLFYDSCLIFLRMLYH